ncbi:acyl carrier protein [Actinospica durhamensis]|uniref:Acyl carrier protein n=1 Tax=Actinospica durhamensis TaxID=1508375 RepID=A0A941ES00_9ACTN|nr:acyl carrier protein [Actinospica durhamensis]MBR7836093.1 acyl carrier protein [Actinospica durhamensis]
MDINDEIEYLRLWESVLQAPIGPDEDLVTAGVDSLRATTLLTRISEAYDVDLDLWDLLDAATPRRVRELVKAAAADPVTGR